jgi:hypothetical protein
MSGFFPDSLRNLSDEELTRMKDRSWVRAARSWSEARKFGLSNTVRMMLTAEAEGEEQFWHALQLEFLRRHDEADVRARELEGWRRLGAADDAADHT